MKNCYENKITRCPLCGSVNVYVAESRDRDGFYMRRRKCIDCAYIWKTREITEDEIKAIEERDAELEELFDVIRIFNAKIRKEKNQDGQRTEGENIQTREGRTDSLHRNQN